MTILHQVSSLFTMIPVKDLCLYNRSRQYYSSGSWDGEIFRDIPSMTRNHMYTFIYKDNKNGSYFTYSLKIDSIISRFLMDVNGQIRQQTWVALPQDSNMFWSQPNVQCEVYAYCGAFGICNTKVQPFCNCLTGFVPGQVDDWNSSVYSGGCVRRARLQCGNSSLINGNSDKFLPAYGVNFPDNVQTVAVESAQECESYCSSNCSCSAYAYDSNQCSIWLGDLLNIREAEYGGKTLYVKLSASEFSSSSNNINKGLVIGVIVGSVVVISLLLLVILRRRKKTSKSGDAVEGSLVAFRYKDLQSATKNFMEKLGGGGFGSVYKGVLRDSSFIAVKKLESINQGEKQFRVEVSTVGAIQHVNLVRLRGFCSKGSRKLLVYDYMPNGSLDHHLFHGNDSSKAIDWKRRYNIALGTARGLEYLQEKCRDRIIHCDVKPENILLDSEFCSKVADFGLAKLFGRDFSRVLTTTRGTRGYLAPEWISGVAITSKVDVYSYGMMLFEFVSGRRNTREQSEDGKVLKFFRILVASQITDGGSLLDLLDARLEGIADEEEVARVCKIACWCVQDDETQRPSMGLVVQILEGVLNVNLPPIPRSFQVLVDNKEHIIFFTEPSSSGKRSQAHRDASGNSLSQSKSFISSGQN